MSIVSERLLAVAAASFAATSSGPAGAAAHETSRVVTLASHYTISGGVQKDLRGQYNQMGASRSCNGKPVYKLHTSDYYLYRANPSSWMVSDEDCMNRCAPEAADLGLYSVGDCAGDPSGSGCAGKWMAATGKDSDYGECNTGLWCTEPGLTVV